MNQVTRKKLWKVFLLFTMFVNAFGVCWNMTTESYWGALGHASCAVLAVLMYLETKEEQEDDEDEQ